MIFDSLSVCSRNSDSDSSGSGPVDTGVSVCGSAAGDSDWDSDLSDSDPHRPTRATSVGTKPPSGANPAEPSWDLFGEATEPQVLTELFTEENNKTDGGRKGSTAPVTTSGVTMVTQPVAVATKTAMVTTEQTKKVTWQFKPDHRSICTGSRKDKEKEVTSSSARYATELGVGATRRPSPSPSSSSSSPSSSSSG